MMPVNIELCSTSIFHKLLMPPLGPSIASCRFSLMGEDPGQSKSSSHPGIDGTQFRVVVEEQIDDLSSHHKNLAPDAVWLLEPFRPRPANRRLFVPEFSPFRWNRTVPSAIALDVLESIGPALLIVPDRASQIIVKELGFPSIISPPAVADNLFHTAIREARLGPVIVPPHPTPYQSLYLDQLAANEITPTALADYFLNGGTRQEGIVIGISLGRSQERAWRLDAALHLASGHTLISEPLQPLHGLEPGIDYFEVTSPQEFFYVLQYLKRSPQSTHLMSLRGRRKAEYFRASRVWENILYAWKSAAAIPD